MKVLDKVLKAPPATTFESVNDFWTAHVRDAAEHGTPVDRAIAGGALADRLGYAFVAGYTAALHALVPTLDPHEPVSLAATEEGGAHPKAIRTRLERSGTGWTLTGEKNWVTLASMHVLVLATKGEDAGGRSQLVVVNLPAKRSGVTVVPQPELPFVPEISHAKLVFDHAPVEDSDLLPGDGWDRWVKPFRTVEDVHVHAAALAYVAATAARNQWPRAVREPLVASLSTFRSLAGEEPSSPITHLALAGAISQARAAVEACAPHWSSADRAQRERWERDRPLLEVARKARQLRLERAWALVESR